MRPVLANGALLISSHMLVEFSALAFMRVQTFTTAIFEEFDLEFNSASGVTLAALLLISCLFFLAFERRMRNGAFRHSADHDFGVACVLAYAKETSPGRTAANALN